jgi:acetyltransferase-like isoleucine patch superfamily enzyme
MLRFIVNIIYSLFKSLIAKLKRFEDWLVLVARCPRTTSCPIGVSIVGRRISLGANTIVEEGVLLEVGQSSSCCEKISIGNNCEIRNGAQIRSWLGQVSIGNNCSINSNTLLFGTGGIIIGNYVRIAANCVIVASSHVYKDCTKPICTQGFTAKGILIEDDVWIGAGACILDGVTIGRGSVIGAGAVVRNSTEPFSVNVGVPAKIIGTRI